VSQQNKNECLLSSFLFHSETLFLPAEAVSHQPVHHRNRTRRRVQKLASHIVLCIYVKTCTSEVLVAVPVANFGGCGIDYKLNLVISTLKDQHVCPSYRSHLHKPISASPISYSQGQAELIETNYTESFSEQLYIIATEH
jgi:hypothetical protein